jgi:preprotein translocase subunit SecB
MATIQSSLAFKSFNVLNVVFERPEEFNSGEFTVEVEHITQVDTEISNKFQTIFIVNVVDKSNVFNLQVKASEDYEIIGEVPPEIYENFVRLNAPAIAYPYLRAFISNMVLQAGMNPIIIPPLNFNKPTVPRDSVDLQVTADSNE